MAECTIEITGCRSVYRPGETIHGEVVVTVSEPIDCRRLTIATSYRANQFESEPRAVELFAGHWEAGAHRYPFELPAPPGPATYRGRSLQVAHALVARSDLAWARDPPAAERRFAVAAEDVAGYDDGPGWPHFFVDGLPGPDAAEHRGPRGCIMPAGLAFISCVGMLFVYAALVTAGAPGTTFWVVFPIALLFMLGPMYVAFQLYRPAFVARGLGRPDLRLDRLTVRAGESTKLHVLYQVPRRLALSGAAVEIECTETMIIGSGKQARVHRQIVHHDGFALELPRPVAARDTIDRVVTLEMPLDASPTFVAPGASVTWAVGVRFMAGRRRHVTRVLPLIVRPPAARSTPGASE